MSKIPYIKYAEMKPFYTIHELCDLFRMGKDDLRDACKRYQVEPRQNEIGDLRCSPSPQQAVPRG